MIFISHRGNIDGGNPRLENSVEYILKAQSLGYQVEIDVWKQNNIWYLGHDQPQYLISEDFLKKDGLWCHAKNLDALVSLDRLNVNYFWHQEDDFTLTSKGFIWTYPGKPLSKNSICVMPEKHPKIKNNFFLCKGICSDYILNYRKIYELDKQ